MLGCRCGILGSSQHQVVSYPYVGWDASVASTLLNASGQPAANGEEIAKWTSFTDGAGANTDWTSPSGIRPSRNSATNSIYFNGSKLLGIKNSDTTLEPWNNTIYIVFNPVNATNKYMFCKGSAEATVYSGFAYYSTPNPSNWIQLNDVGYLISGGNNITITNNTKQIITFNMKSTVGGTQLFWKNAVQGNNAPAMQAAGVTLDRNDWCIGTVCDSSGNNFTTYPFTDSGWTYNGYIHEIRIYSGNHTQQQVTDITNELKAKWGIA